MEKEEPKQGADLYNLVAWAHTNRKRLITISAIVVGVIAVISIYTWHKNSHETEASEQLSLIVVNPNTRGADAAASAAQYAKVGDAYGDTSAGALAMLLAGQMYFEAGQYPQAQAQFERYMAGHANYPLTSQALAGLAACLDASGKVPEAVARYEELLRSHQQDSTAPQVKAALGRLYLAQNKPEQALHTYEDLLKLNMGGNNTWIAEATIHGQELLVKHPELRKPIPAPPIMGTNAPALDLRGGG